MEFNLTKEHTMKQLAGIILFAASVLVAQNQTDLTNGFRFYTEWNADSTLHYLVPLYQKNPGIDSVGLAIAEASLWKKDFKTATTVIANLQKPESAESWRVRGLLYEQVGRLAEALVAYDKAIPFLKQPWGTMERKAQVLAWSGKRNEAKNLIQKVLASPEISMGLRSRSELHLALWLAWDKDLDQSIKLIERILQREPNHVEAMMQLAQVFEWKGNYKGAKHLFGKVLEVQPSHGEARLKLGRLQWVQ